MKISLRQLFLAFSLVFMLAVAGMAITMWQSIGESNSAVQHSLKAQKTLEQFRELHIATKDYLQATAAQRVSGNSATDLDDTKLLLKRIQERVRSAINTEISVLVSHDPEEAEEERAELALLDKIIALTDSRAESISKIVAQNASRQDGGIEAGMAAMRDAMSGELGQILTNSMQNEQQETSAATKTASENLASMERRGLLLLIALVVVFFAGTFFLQYVLVKPVQALHTVVRQAAKGGKFTTITDNRLVEFAELQLEFGMMLDEVRAHRDRFTRDNAELERIIKLRTEELTTANEKLTAADRARVRFLSDISHELRTPLTLIRGEADIGLRIAEREGADLRGALRRVKEISDQMAVLVDDLLFLSRFQDAGLRLDMGEYNLTQLLQQVVGDSQSQAQRSGVRMEIVPNDEVLVAACDRARIRQALLILLDNASRYAAQNGHVKASLHRDGAMAIFAISNDGPGINAADIKHVFERYFRAEAARNRNKSGIGIGLSIAKVIVEAHQGSITAESTPDVCTTFNIKIPITGIMNANTRH